MFVLYDYEFLNYYCPNCYKTLTSGCMLSTYKYCYNCGTKLSWEIWDRQKQQVKKAFKITKQSHQEQSKRLINNKFTQTTLF